MSFIRDRLRWLVAAALGLALGLMLHSAWLAFAAAAGIALLLALLAFAGRIAERIEQQGENDSVG